MKISGKLEKRDLEGGILQLAADDGRRWTLQGGGPDLQRAAGRRVEVEGEADQGAFGFAMAGPTFRVRSFRVL